MQNYRANTTSYHHHRPMPTPASPMMCDTRNEKSLAMAYVPWQVWRDIYEVEKGFRCGTIFQELNMPFLGKGGARR